MWCQKRELYYFSMWVSKKRHTQRERERHKNKETKLEREREKKTFFFKTRQHFIYTHARAL